MTHCDDIVILSLVSVCVRCVERLQSNPRTQRATLDDDIVVLLDLVGVEAVALKKRQQL